MVQAYFKKKLLENGYLIGEGKDEFKLADLRKNSENDKNIP